MGIDYEVSVSGKLKYSNGAEYAFDGASDGSGGTRPKSGDLSALWFKFGGGLDLDLNQSLYLRFGLLYGIRTANTLEKDGANTSLNAGTRLGHGLTFRAGAGFRL